jgi:tripartite-type tricarboxylate transporter receptor subunit TctC
MRALVAALMIAFAAPAVAQDYPSKPIKFVIPYAAGGPTDILGRVVGTRLAEKLGQPVVIENRPGASGMIGQAQVAKSDPDGYTILVNASIHVINPSLFATMTSDPIKDFVPVTQLAAVPLVLVVNPQTRANSVSELIALAKKEPGKLSFASSGIGAAPHLAGELLKSRTGTNIQHVPYKGSGPAINDLVGGHVTMMIDSMPSSMAQVQGGALKALAVSTAKRVAAMPNVPTMMEQGVADFDVATWYGVWAPAGTPKPIVDKLQREIAAILKEPGIKERYAGLGADPIGSTPEEFDAYCRSELARWAEVVKISGAKLE